MPQVGIFGKQTAGIFQSMATRTTIRRNVMFNGPRAGINFNDVLGGGHLVEHNLLFNWNRWARGLGAGAGCAAWLLL